MLRCGGVCRIGKDEEFEAIKNWVSGVVCAGVAGELLSGPVGIAKEGVQVGEDGVAAVEEIAEKPRREGNQADDSARRGKLWPRTNRSGS